LAPHALRTRELQFRPLAVGFPGPRHGKTPSTRSRVFRNFGAGANQWALLWQVGFRAMCAASTESVSFTVGYRPFKSSAITPRSIWPGPAGAQARLYEGFGPWRRGPGKKSVTVRTQSGRGRRSIGRIAESARYADISGLLVPVVLTVPRPIGNRVGRLLSVSCSGQEIKRLLYVPVPCSRTRRHDLTLLTGQLYVIIAEYAGIGSDRDSRAHTAVSNGDG
jgi:hypothetical protein